MLPDAAGLDLQEKGFHDYLYKDGQAGSFRKGIDGRRGKDLRKRNPAKQVAEDSEEIEQKIKAYRNPDQAGLTRDPAFAKEKEKSKDTGRAIDDKCRPALEAQ